MTYWKPSPLLSRMERLVDKRFFVGHFRNKTFSGKALESFIPEMTSKKTFTYTKQTNIEKNVPYK